MIDKNRNNIFYLCIVEYKRSYWYRLVLDQKFDIFISWNDCINNYCNLFSCGKWKIWSNFLWNCLFEQVYWCSKQQKSSKNKSSELTSFSTNAINVKTPRPKEIKLFPIIPKLVQPNSSSLILPSIEDNHINGDTFATDTCSTAGSSSSSTAAATKKFRKKNLLER
jgi:hypothetical protein